MYAASGVWCGVGCSECCVLLVLGKWWVIWVLYVLRAVGDGCCRYWMLVLVLWMLGARVVSAGCWCWVCRMLVLWGLGAMGVGCWCYECCLLVLLCWCCGCWVLVLWVLSDGAAGAGCYWCWILWVLNVVTAGKHTVTLPAGHDHNASRRCHPPVEMFTILCLVVERVVARV